MFIYPYIIKYKSNTIDISPDASDESILLSLIYLNRCDLSKGMFFCPNVQKDLS